MRRHAQIAIALALVSVSACNQKPPPAAVAPPPTPAEELASLRVILEQHPKGSAVRASILHQIAKLDPSDAEAAALLKDYYADREAREATEKAQEAAAHTEAMAAVNWSDEELCKGLKKARGGGPAREFARRGGAVKEISMNGTDLFFVGMSRIGAYCSLGRPDKINRTVASYGTHEQWVYSGTYVYIEDGVLTAVQD